MRSSKRYLSVANNLTDAIASSAFSKSSGPTLTRPIPDVGSDGLVGEQAGVPISRRASVDTCGFKKARSTPRLLSGEMSYRLPLCRRSTANDPI